MENIQDYSSDSEEEEDQEELSSIETTNSKRSLPPVPQNIIDKFAKRPKLPHPEFYDNPNYNNLGVKNNMKGFIRQFAYIDIRCTKRQAKLVSLINEELKTVLRIEGLAEILPRFENLHLSNLEASLPLHVSLSAENFITPENSQKFDKELLQRLSTIKKENENSNLLTFDGISAFPNFDHTGLFFALNLSKDSKTTCSKLLNAVKALEEEYVDPDYLRVKSHVLPATNTLHCSIAKIYTPMGYLTKQGNLEKIQRIVKGFDIPKEINFRYSQLKILKDQVSLSFPIGDFENQKE